MVPVQLVAMTGQRSVFYCWIPSNILPDFPAHCCHGFVSSLFKCEVHAANGRLTQRYHPKILFRAPRTTETGTTLPVFVIQLIVAGFSNPDGSSL